MITLQVKRSVRFPISKSVLLRAAQLSMDSTNSSTRSDLTIVVAGDSFLRKLNRQYRGVDSTTDVLSFPSGEIDPDTSDFYLGDVIISLPRAEEQAAAEGHPLVDELQLLVVHGVLHLLGYDHLKTTDKKKMQIAQDKILQSLGLNISYTL